MTNVEELRAKYKEELMRDDKFLVVLHDENWNVESYKILKTQREVREMVKGRKKWHVYGRYDFAENGRVGALIMDS
jgi:hypothetical protein